jgi:hypothetical protein
VREQKKKGEKKRGRGTHHYLSQLPFFFATWVDLFGTLVFDEKKQ